MSIRTLALLTVLAAMLPQAASGEERAAAEAPVQAVWKQQVVPFHFHSFRTFYSCSSLEAKIKRILLALGAAPETKLRVRGCPSPHEISTTPYVEINVMSPVVANREELAALEETRGTRELAARVRGNTQAAAEAAAPFLAQWTAVSLSRGELDLEAGDCELIDELKAKVLPKLAVEIVSDDVRCSPNQSSLTQPKLVVKALLPMREMADR